MILAALILSLPCACTVAPPPDDVAQELAALAAPTSIERERAERWLAAHVEAEDFALLREAGRAGDVEVRRRLARALGAADRHLALAVRFLREDTAELRRLGSQAVQAALARWNPDLIEPPVAGEELRRALLLLGEHGRSEVLQLDLAAPLAESLGILARRAEVPLAMVLEPGLSTRPSFPAGGGPALATGPWWELVLRLAGAHGVGVEAFGVPIEREAEPGPPGGFLHLTPLAEAGRGNGATMVERWCRALGAPRGTPGRAAAAEALAGMEWPAARVLLKPCSSPGWLPAPPTRKRAAPVKETATVTKSSTTGPV